jgi:hypothetical protein
MKIVIALTIVLTSQLSFAMSLNSEALLACIKIESSNQRLICFDQAMANISLNETTKNDMDLSGAISTASQSDKNAAPIVKTTPPQNAKANFGLEKQKLRENKTQLESIDASVVSIQELASAQKVLTLDNQQRWQQISSGTFRIKVGDTLVLTRGAFGSFKLKKQGTNRAIKVKRLD